MSDKGNDLWEEHMREMQEEQAYTGSVFTSAVMDIRAGKELEQLENEQLDALVAHCESLLRERLGDGPDLNNMELF